MATVNAEEVRIPRGVREAVSRHEQVLVLNRERAVLALVHPDDLPHSTTRRRGRAVREIVAILAGAPGPDPGFDADMAAVRADVGAMPGDPWER